MNPAQMDPRMLAMALRGQQPTTPGPGVGTTGPAPQPVAPFDPSQFSFMGQGANGFDKFLQANGATLNPVEGNGMQKGYYMPNSMMNLNHAG